MTFWGFAFALYQAVAILVSVWIGYRISRSEPILPKRKDPIPEAKMVFKTDEEEAEAEMDTTVDHEATSPSLSALRALKEQYERTVGEAQDNGIHGIE